MQESTAKCRAPQTSSNASRNDINRASLDVLAGMLFCLGAQAAENRNLDDIRDIYLGGLG
jgi:hypothetical protein